MANFTFSQLTTDYSRPQAGAEYWYDTWQVSIPNISGSDRYTRFNWAGLNPTQGQYNWTVFNTNINKAIDAKQGFSFGLMTQYSGGQGSVGIANFSGAYSSYPQWLHTQMMAESVKPLSSGGDWVPNYNSPSYLTALETFYKALYNHINTTTYKGVLYKNAINSIDIRGYGNFGEWHNWPYGATAPSTPSVATLKKIVDIHKTSLPDIRLSALSDGVNGGSNGWSAANAEVGYYLLTQSNAAGPFGIRRDSWGATEAWYNQNLWENNPGVFNGVQLKTLIMDKWKTAPITGEPCCNSGYAQLPAQVTKYHVNSFGNGNYGSVTNSNVVNASKLAGPRITLIGGTTTTSAGTVVVTLNWSNIGTTPVYTNWNAILKLRGGNTIVQEIVSSFDLKLFLPGTKITTDTITGIPAGIYTIDLEIQDATGYRAPYPLAISGRQSDGSYSLGQITITGAGDTTTTTTSTTTRPPATTTTSTTTKPPATTTTSTTTKPPATTTTTSTTTKPPAKTITEVVVKYSDGTQQTIT